MIPSLNRVLLKLNQGADFRNKEDELSLMFKDNRFERFILNVWLKVKRWCFVPEPERENHVCKCLSAIHPHHLRCISIEDTDEAKFRFHKNHVKLYYPSEGESIVVNSASLLRSGFRMNRTESDDRSSRRGSLGFS
jgi:type IV secretion system protein VirB11